MNVDAQAQIQLPALSLKELIQPSAMTALDQPFVFLAVIMRLLSQSPAHSAGDETGTQLVSRLLPVRCFSRRFW